MPLSGAYFYPGLNGGLNYSPLTVPINVSTSSSFLGDSFSVVFGPMDVVKYRNYKISMINNSVNNLKSGSLEVSANGTNWEVVNSASFLNLTSSGIVTVQLSDVSNQSLRVRAWTSGATGGFSGSTLVILTAN